MITTAMITTTVIRRAGSPCLNHPASRKHTRPLGGGNTRLTAVNRSTQVVIAERHVLVIALHGSEVNMALVLSRQFVRAGPHTQAALTTVEAHTVYRDVVDYRLVVDVGDVNASKVGNGPVVVERPMAPVAALETNTAVPVAVVDSAVEAYVRSPIAGMP
jgi:hypothetical protein